MSQAHPNSLTKAERLRGKRAIDALFQAGHKGTTVYPLRAVCAFYPATPHTPHAAILIAVSKHKIKRAVGRNRVKRQVREAYRTNKHALVAALEAAALRVDIAFIWLAPTPLPTNRVEASLKTILCRIAERATRHITPQATRP